MEFVHESVEGQFQLRRGLVDTCGDLLADRFHLLVTDLRQSADPVEHLPQRGDLDLVAGCARLTVCPASTLNAASLG